MRVGKLYCKALYPRARKIELHQQKSLQGRCSFLFLRPPDSQRLFSEKNRYNKRVLGEREIR